MNGYGAFRERYWQETFELLETSLSAFHSLYHKSDMDGPEFEDACPQREPNN
jgi:hypothetical protein